MSSLPTGAQWSIIAVVVLLLPTLALLMFVAVEITVDFLTGIGMTTLLGLVVAGTVGRLLFRKLRVGDASAAVET